MKIYSTMTRQKEDLKSIDTNKIKLFVCGPTVYDDAHIGHGRTYIFFDVIKRYLEYIGYSVFYLQNITDVDDKIIEKAKTLNCEASDIAKVFEKRYIEDMHSLNVNNVNIYAKSTDFIDEIISQIARIMDNGFAYETDDGVYFEVRKFESYGELSNRKIDELESHRKIAKTSKKDSHDFVLWKKRENTNEPVWDSPWGKGRPGWHIEDTAITEYFFDNKYDIHGGGLDLMFPHHEAEIAQIKAISDDSTVNYWLHSGFLNISGLKMSKSLNNFLSIRDVLKEFSPEVFRFFIISSHYRSHVEFSKDDLVQAEKALNKIKNYAEKLNETKIDKSIKARKNPEYPPLKKVREEFFNSMDDDFNTSKAISSLFIFINDSKKELFEDKIHISDILDIQEFFKEISNILGMDFNKCTQVENNEDLLDLIVDIRKKLREEKLYEFSDEIRDKLIDLGINIEDE
ncbi:cysteine--tRNA ligase [Methanobrevibacter sp. DSM 116169]|uniref:cysteine--tRNA ligase n=1 Tax=Methanobrevibacter sp. DSM 116169 TaxID=3242727 RepID=UPI0038FCFA39